MAKRQTKNKVPSKRWEAYSVDGESLVRKKQFSPKAESVFMAEHKDRRTCGKTGYTEFKSKEQK